MNVPEMVADFSMKDEFRDSEQDVTAACSYSTELNFDKEVLFC